MKYVELEGKVVYTAKDQKISKRFPALAWLAAMCSHMPNRGEQIVRYYGYYSNVARGKRKREASDDLISCIIETVENDKTFRKNRATFFQKIFEVAPLICPKCKGTMKIVSFIEDTQVIQEILMHLGIWLVRSRPPVHRTQAGPKSMPPSHCPNPKPPIPARILPIHKPTVTPTLNTHGTITRVSYGRWNLLMGLVLHIFIGMTTLWIRVF